MRLIRSSLPNVLNFLNRKYCLNFPKESSARKAERKSIVTWMTHAINFDVKTTSFLGLHRPPDIYSLLLNYD
jgi:hypothetical protein